ncbi:MAG TPA: hypothetical protein ENJ28_04900 [Gammaproteobacteria bacterium]|nr:hypothetical protein [Gammaproteobacteria bacterium]
MFKSILAPLISLDKLINGLLLGNPKETISSRFARNAKKTWVAEIGCHVIAFILRDPNHCKKSLQLNISGKNSNDNPVILLIILCLIIYIAYRFSSLWL